MLPFQNQLNLANLASMSNQFPPTSAQSMLQTGMMQAQLANFHQNHVQNQSLNWNLALNSMAPNIAAQLAAQQSQGYGFPGFPNVFGQQQPDQNKE